MALDLSGFTPFGQKKSIIPSTIPKASGLDLSGFVPFGTTPEVQEPKKAYGTWTPYNLITGTIGDESESYSGPWKKGHISAQQARDIKSVGQIPRKSALPEKEPTGPQFGEYTTEQGKMSGLIPGTETRGPIWEQALKETPTEKDGWLKNTAKFLIPRSLERKFLNAEPTEREEMWEREDARFSYLRQKEYDKLYSKEMTEVPTIPERYQEPEGFWGSLWEGVGLGSLSSIKAGMGYFIESQGRQMGSPEMIKAGMRIGDQTTIDILKRPELYRPDDLEGFWQGGIIDPRWWGRTIGESIPFIGATIAFSTLGALVGGVPGATAAAYGSVFALEKGNSYKRYIDEGNAPDKADLYSSVYGAIAAAIENAVGIAPAKVGMQIISKPAQRILYNSYKSYAMTEIPKIGWKILKTSLGEGGEEVAQSLTESLISKWGEGEGRIVLSELGEEFASGFAASLPFGAATSIKTPSVAGGGATIVKGLKKIKPGLTIEFVDGKPKPTPEAREGVIEPIKPKEGVIPQELATEAKKYKSAEEFVDAQGKEIYHATDKQFDKFDPTLTKDEYGTWFTSIKDDAYNLPKHPIVREVIIKKDVKLILESKFSKVENTDEYLNYKGNYYEYLLEKGYKGIDYENGSIVLFEPNKDTINVKQLTDIYNQGKTAGKEAGVAKSIEAKAIKLGIAEQFEGLAEYSPVVIKEQVATISKLIETDIERAKKMATGVEPLDSDIKGAMLVKMMEDYAMENKDGDFILELAKSPLVTATSEAGQTLRLIRERTPDSATAMIKDVQNVREEVAKKRRRGRTKTQEKSKIKKSLDKKIEQGKKKISKYSWDNLLKEIAC